MENEDGDEDVELHYFKETKNNNGEKGYLKMPKTLLTTKDSTVHLIEKVHLKKCTSEKGLFKIMDYDKIVEHFLYYKERYS